jgi:mannosyltransferase
MTAARSVSVPMPSRVGDRYTLMAETLAIFAIALGIRLYGLAFKPYWMDEITTIRRASQPFLTMVSDSLTFHHLPTYFSLMSWVIPFGIGETALRLPSALCGALTCAVAAGIGRMVGGGPAGIMAGLFTAFSPLQVNFSQEARPQALVVLLIAIALHGLVELALDPKGASLPLRDAGARRRAWATYVVAALAAVNVLGVALLLLVFGWLAMLVVARHPEANRSQLLRNSALIHGAIAIVTVPGYVAMYFFVRASGRLLEGLDWIPPVTLTRLWSDIGSVYLLQISSPISSRLFSGAVPFMNLVVAAFAVLGLSYLWRKGPVFAVLALGVIILPLGLLAISIVVPMWLPRYLLWSAVPFFIVSGLGIAQLRGRFQVPAVVVVGSLAFVNLAPYYEVEMKPRWDLAAASLQPAIANHDLVLVADAWVPRMMNVYLSRSGTMLAESQWTSDVGVAMTRLADGGRVWAVFGRVGQVDHEDLDHFLLRISPLGSPATEIRSGLDVITLLFDASGSPHRAKAAAN